MKYDPRPKPKLFPTRDTIAGDVQKADGTWAQAVMSFQNLSEKEALKEFKALIEQENASLISYWYL